jgi:hypothetical protein
VAGKRPSGSGLASFYTAVVDGLAIRARNGAARKALGIEIRCAMAAPDTVVAQSQRIRPLDAHKRHG